MTINAKHQQVTATATPAAYIGGKRSLAKRIISIIDTIPHTTYAEPFVGMGGVFLRRHNAPKAEIINDLNGDVSNLFRILQRHYPQFMDTLRFQISSRREFQRLCDTDPNTLTDLERAARFLYLQRLSFGGRVARPSFGIDPARTSRFNLTKLAPMLEDVHERLSGVVIENRAWQSFVAAYDRPETLFYLDPPYWGCEDDYGTEMFDQEQFKVMAHTLTNLKGRFILSINDVPEIRKMFSKFNIHSAELNYSTAGGAKSRRAKELIIVG